MRVTPIEGIDKTRLKLQQKETDLILASFAEKLSCSIEKDDTVYVPTTKSYICNFTV